MISRLLATLKSLRKLPYWIKSLIIVGAEFAIAFICASYGAVSLCAYFAIVFVLFVAQEFNAFYNFPPKG